VKTCIALTCMFFLGTLCSAQDLTSIADQDSNQTVAAAAAESRVRVKDEVAKKADIRHLLEITGAANLGSQSMNEMEKTMRPLIAGALPPGDYRDKLVDLFFEKFRSKRNPDQLLAIMVPIYGKYFSDDDIKQLIQMYETPIGQKMLSSLPKVVAESQAAGKAWGEEIGRQCMLEVLAEHPELQAALQNAKKDDQQH
jgi:uncharacterized protein